MSKWRRILIVHIPYICQYCQHHFRGKVKVIICLDFLSYVRDLSFFTAKTEFVVFWGVATCGVMAGYQRFGGPCCLHLHGWSQWWPRTSTLNMWVTRSSETLVSNHHTTWHNNPENHEFFSRARACVCVCVGGGGGLCECKSVSCAYKRTASPWDTESTKYYEIISNYYRFK
jgi:hypothetical protein